MTAVHEAAQPDQGQLVDKGALSAMLAPVRSRLVLGIGLAVLSVLFGALAYISVVEIGRVLLSGGRPDGRAWLWAGLAVVGAVLQFVCYGTAMRVCHYADADFRHTTRSRLAVHLAGLSLGWFTAGGSGRVKQAVSDDVKRMHMIVAHAAVDVTVAILTPLVALVYLLLVDWRFALILIGYLVLSVAIAAPSMSRAYRMNIDEWNRSMGALASATVELADGIDVVKTYGSSVRASSRYHDAVDRVVRLCLTWTAAMGRPTALMSILFAPASVIVVIVVTGTWLLSAGWIEPVTLLAFLVMGVGLPAAPERIGNMANLFREAQLGATHVRRVLAEPPLPEPAEPRRAHGHRVELDRVRFGYDGEHDVLHDISLTLDPGTVTALVGPSGSGKTTLARLIPRFWDVTGGSIRVGGVDIREQETHHLLARMAIVFQDVVLLRDTIRENIRIGHPEATDAEVEQAARRAQIHDVIAALPDGYDTVIGEGFGQLSGGERQRVTIARAILQAPPIVILDEATAHADPHSEAAIQRALAELSHGTTMLVIAHRLHTIINADQIVVLDAGRIAEQGRHDTLLATGGLYARMWAAQQHSITEEAR